MLVTCDFIQFRVLTGRSILQTLQVKYAMANGNNKPSQRAVVLHKEKRYSANRATAAHQTPRPKDHQTKSWAKQLREKSLEGPNQMKTMSSTS